MPGYYVVADYREPKLGSFIGPVEGFTEASDRAYILRLQRPAAKPLARLPQEATLAFGTITIMRTDGRVVFTSSTPPIGWDRVAV